MLPSLLPGPGRLRYTSAVGCANNVCAPPRCHLHPQRPDETTSYPDQFLSRVFPCEFSSCSSSSSSTTRTGFVSDSRRSRPSQFADLQNGAEEARARLGVARLCEPLPPSTVLLSDRKS